MFALTLCTCQWDLFIECKQWHICSLLQILCVVALLASIASASFKLHYAIACCFPWIPIRVPYTYIYVWHSMCVHMYICINMCKTDANPCIYDVYPPPPPPPCIHAYNIIRIPSLPSLKYHKWQRSHECQVTTHSTSWPHPLLVHMNACIMESQANWQLVVMQKLQNCAKTLYKENRNHCNCYCTKQ